MRKVRQDETMLENEEKQMKNNNPRPLPNSKNIQTIKKICIKRKIDREKEELDEEESEEEEETEEEDDESNSQTSSKKSTTHGSSK